MHLPQAPLYCIQALEAAGYRAYAVGGCVRDSLLGLTPHDYDICTNATPEETSRVFSGHQLVRAGEKHGTIGVIIDRELYEITTFRQEGGYLDSRHPDWVRFVSTVEEDLSRRDFTVNAMAYSPKEGYIDPWGGQEDLQNHILRAVGDPTQRFAEDALRILRGVRFAVRFHLTPDQETMDAMAALSGRMENLARERVFDELCKLLPLVNAEDLLRYAPILASAVPAIGPMIGFLQHSPHHAWDVFTHSSHVVENVPADLTLRWAALLHDTGKPACFTQDENGRGHFKGHAAVSKQIAEEALLELKAPTRLREEVCTLIGLHMTPLEADRKLLRRRLGKLGEDILMKLLTLQEADMGSKGTGIPEEMEQFPRIRAVLAQVLQEDACLKIADLAVTGNDLLQLGFAPDPNLGRCLQFLLEQVQDEQLPNEKEALLNAAKGYL